MKLLLERPAFETLRARMRGAVIDPADPEYDIARRGVHNGMIDGRPAVIARCAGVADVMVALRFGIAQACPSRCAAAATTSPGRPSAKTAWSSTCRR